VLAQLWRERSVAGGSVVGGTKRVLCVLEALSLVATYVVVIRQATGRKESNRRTIMVRRSKVKRRPGRCLGKQAAGDQ
jgi:hypothetical protein